MEPIFQFLSGRRTNDKPTHLSMIDPRGKFCIQGRDADEFMDLYCMHSTDTKFGLLEATSQLPVLPVLVDADIKKEVEEEPRPIIPLYDLKFILKVVQVYQEVLKNILKGVTDEDLLCVVLQKDPYFLSNEKTCKKYVKNGFHLQFPRCFLSKKSQMDELLPRVKMEWKKQVSISEFGLSIDSVLDKSYCQGTPWLLYGSCKALNMDPYVVSFIVDGEGQIQENWRSWLFDIQMQRMDRSKIDLDWDNIDFYLPRILSVSPLGREHYIYELREDLDPVSPQKPTSILPRIVQCAAVSSDEPPIHKMIDDLLEILNDHRAEDRNEWMMVGWTLYNIYNGSKEGLESWIRFSKRSPSNFDVDVCRYQWSKMTKREMTIGTLKFMAKTDNPSGYNEVMKQYMQPFFDKAMKLNGSHNDLAKALYEKYEEQYVCASIKEKIWFEYNDHVWNRIDDGFSLRMKISDEIVKSYEIVMQDLTARYARCDEEEQPMVNKKLKNCMRIISCLKQAPYKTNIMKECCEVFYKPKFFSELDNNPYLFTFKNGVYDLKQHIFRDGRPSDKISIRSPIPYRTDFHMEHKEVKDLLDFFEKIFPDQSIRDYFFDVSAQVFIGGNLAKIVQVWTGEGDNGKSVTQTLFEKMLGSFSIKLPTSLVVGKRTQSSACSPELVRAGNGVRMAMIQEPDAKDEINVGILKELSGNDTFFARGLFKDGSEITPMFKLVIICNDTPRLSADDKACWNRIRVIPFESTFTDNPPADVNQQFLDKKFMKDTTLGTRIGSMAEAFAWFLIEHLKRNPKIRSEPEKVLQATNNYKMRNDLVRLYFDEMLDRKSSEGLHLSLVHNHFKEWYKNGFPGRQHVEITNFKNSLLKILGEKDFYDGFVPRIRFKPQKFSEKVEDVPLQEDSDSEDENW